ncbi:unnamed protein product [Timema podura]|uniref:L-Fucosyltransferase n=1 Tax=Timema podura TaxID=61482 RepID=A0ABN7PQH2_TIMPD|nr:unnamed protein product [Timema podura]
MLRKLISDSASSHNIAFILASDDKFWCKAKLLPEIQEEIQNFGNETNLGGSNVFYLGDQETPEVDLVMLSSCNHSIIAYGTYGLWSALMVNGWTVVYDIEAKNNPVLIKLMKYAPIIFAKKLQKWVALS